MAVFAAVALFLAAIGIYGVTSYSVNQRQQEMGIRLAIGATSRDLVWLVMRQGLTSTIIGLAIGVVGALTLGQFLATLLYEITPTDPITFAGVATLLTLVALAANLEPALRATRVDPVTALRAE
jgi:ABC-type antimicrobial peptide transport system permease subunit